MRIIDRPVLVSVAFPAFCPTTVIVHLTTVVVELPFENVTVVLFCEPGEHWLYVGGKKTASVQAVNSRWKGQRNYSITVLSDSGMEKFEGVLVAVWARSLSVTR